MRLAGVVLSACFASAVAAAEPIQLLTRALSAPARAFSAAQTTTVAMQGGVADTKVKLICNGSGSTRREFMLDGQASVVLLQIGRSSWQFSEGKWLKLPDAVEVDARSAAREISLNYSIVAAPAVVLSGRKAIPLSLKPKRGFCPSRKLWVDAATGIVLRDQLFAPDGRLRSSTVTASIQFRSQEKSLFAKPPSAAESEQFGPASFRPCSSREEAQRVTGRSPAMPAHVPAGFRPVVYGVMSTGSARKMPAVRFSDGLASFTIFERGQGRRGRGWQGGRAQPQDVQLKSDIQRSVVQVQGGRSFILVGDIAEDELRAVANSLS